MLEAILISAYLYMQGDRVQTVRYKFPDMPTCEKSLKAMRIVIPNSAGGDFVGFVVAHCANEKNEKFYSTQTGWETIPTKKD